MIIMMALKEEEKIFSWARESIERSFSTIAM
jgi:hypothetical protein